MQIIRLPLEGTSNTRDIGGYIGNNKLFKWRKVLRSDCLSKITDNDKEYLINKYNLKKVIDLRSVPETLLAENALAKDDRVQYINISLADEIDPNKPLDLRNISKDFLSDFYINLLENKQENIKAVLKEIINLDEDASVLFHCTAGKDRTGVVAMLLLGICGVNKQDISTNYMQTATNLKYNKHFAESNKKLAEKFKSSKEENLIEKIVSSNEKYIEYTYDKLIEKYSTFKNYFIHIGITENEITKLIESITENME